MKRGRTAVSPRKTKVECALCGKWFKPVGLDEHNTTMHPQQELALPKP